MSVVLQGLLVLAAAAGSANPHLSTDATTITAVAPPYGAAAAASPNAPVPALVRHVGRQHPRVLGYARVGSYFDDYYQRIHINPLALALGTIGTVQTHPVEVWNAFVSPAQSQTLASVVSAGADGITLTAPGVVPMIFAPNQDAVWTLAITPDGPPVINAGLTWTFTGLDPQTVLVTGDRVVAWSWRCNWADGVTEREAWFTDIPRSRAGAEQRIARRLTPRRNVEFSFIAQGDARKLAEQSLFGWAQRVWALPVWPDVSLLQADAAVAAGVLALDTTHRDFVDGGLLLLRASATQYEVAAIGTISAGSIALAFPLVGAWPSGTRVYPLRNARLVGTDGFANPTADILSGRVAFAIEQACAWPALLPSALYRGTPVYEVAALWSAERALAYGTLLERIDPQLGLPYVVDAAQRTFPRWAHRVRLQGLDARATLRSLGYALRGAQGAIWVPTWQADLALAADSTVGAVTLDVRSAGVERFANLQPSRRDLRVQFASGTVSYARVTGITVPSAGVERLALDTGMAEAALVAAPPRISWMLPARMASDTLEYAYSAAQLAWTTLTWQAVPDDL